MVEYIERKRAIVDACNSLELYPSEYATLEDALNKSPVADVAEVVRCRDCKYGDYDSKVDDAMVCIRTNDGYWRHGNDFCNYGRLKDINEIIKSNNK